MKKHPVDYLIIALFFLMLAAFIDVVRVLLRAFGVAA